MSDTSRFEVFTLVAAVLIKLKSISAEGKIERMTMLMNEMFGHLTTTKTWEKAMESLNQTDGLPPNALLEELFEIGQIAINEYQDGLITPTQELREAVIVLDSLSKRNWPSAVEVRSRIKELVRNGTLTE